MSFRPYFLEGGTALERGLQTAAEALGQGIINRAEQTTYQNALTQLGIPLDTFYRDWETEEGIVTGKQIGRASCRERV